MASPDEHVLRLNLKGRAVSFPGGTPFCLACGGKPAGTRHVHFTGMLDLDAPDPLQADARESSVDFDAPLCSVHLGKARLFTAGAIGMGLVTVGVGALGFVLRMNSWLSWTLIAATGIPALALWYFKDKGGLPCSAGSGRTVGFGLWYANGAPRASSHREPGRPSDRR